MGFTSEIYLTKKKVDKNDWLLLLKTIADYNGYLVPGKIIIQKQNSELRFFVKSKWHLPATISQLDSFLIKDEARVKLPKANFKVLTIPKIGSSLIDLISFNEVRMRGSLIYLEIYFTKIGEDKIKYKVYYWLEKDNIITKYRMLLGIPGNLLNIDWENNKSYFYKSAPKYLDIKKVMPLLNKNSTDALLKVDTFPYLEGDYYLNLNNFNFNKHSVIVGSSGCGKSKLISLLISKIKNDEELKSKYKVIVIDPHAALESDVGGLGRVIDFNTSEDSVDLFINSKEDVIASTELILELFKSLIGDGYNAKLERVLRHSIHLLLTKEAFDFANLRKVILDLEFRNDLIKELKASLPTSVIDFFLTDFNDLKTKSYGEAISPIIAFIDEMEMIPVFNKQEKLINLTETIKDNFLTIFSLNRIKLGDKVTKTIAGLIMQQLLTIVQRREIDEHIIFIIDEVAVVENPILVRYLAEARKFNLSLILAGQYFNQITENLKTAIFANVVNYFIFRVAKLDANVLVDNFEMKVPLDDTRERKLKILTSLNNRECIARWENAGKLMPAFKASTMDYTSIPRIKTNNIAKIENTPKEIKPIRQLQIDNIDLKDLMKKNSSSRKVISNE